ncbi:MAG: hypothetical protein M1837_001017, partial [Sclerophora amabilis]
MPDTNREEHNYRCAQIRWQFRALEQAQRSVGNGLVAQAENILHRQMYRAGTASYDRHVVV